MQQGSRSVSSGAVPVALLAEILQHVPQKQRLCQCALVSTAWAAAAAQATMHVNRKLGSRCLPALRRWLKKHAGQVLSIQLQARHPASQHELQLPLRKLTKLQQLHLEGFSLQLRCKASRSAAGSSHKQGGQTAQLMLFNLQHLELARVQLSNISSLTQLMLAPQLSSLSLSDIDFTEGKITCKGKPGPRTTANVQKVADVMPRMLQQLPQLSVLKLDGLPFTDAAAQQLSAMQGLQSLSIRHNKCVALCDLQLLPSSITRLQLHGDKNASTDDSNIMISSPKLPPELPLLAGLLHLELYGCAVPPKALSSCTQLQVLCLRNCRLVRKGYSYSDETAGTAALVTVLASLTCLQDLRLDALKYTTFDEIDLQGYSALTASRHLTRLSLAQDTRSLIPQGAVQHMFPSGRQMQSLQHLTISRAYAWPDAWCISGADLQHVCTCCPLLEHLDIRCSVQPGADLSALLQLPASCNTLWLGGHAFTDAAVPILLQLTQLKHLSWAQSRQFRDAGLEQLVGLDLKTLHVYMCDVSLRTDKNDVDAAFRLQSSHTLGSVSKQLDALCDLSRMLAPARLKKHREAAALEKQQLQQEVSSLREQLAGSQAEVLQLKQQLSAQQQ